MLRRLKMKLKRQKSEGIHTIRVRTYIVYLQNNY